MDSSIEVNDFKFHALQRTRLFPAGTSFSISRSAVAVSSHFQIGIATSGGNQLVSFPSSAVHSLTVTKENTNKENTSVPTKIVPLARDDVVVGLATNADGTLLAVLANCPAGAFLYVFDVAAFALEYTGDIYQVCSIRLSADPSARGVVCSWNPALADTIAASASDNSLVIAKVDTKNPSSYSLVSSKKFPAAVTHISWSPKGKQLTVGDASGKVSQLKMELDVVRTTAPPAIQGIPAGTAPSVSGLCWVSTTEWLVSFSAASISDTFVFLLTLKKDQPVSWRPIPELQYGSEDSPLSPCISSETALLVPWNLSILASAKSSEISVFGKKGDAWKLWNLDDEARIDLPTDSSTRETFPVGASVDLSASREIVLSEDGAKKHPPSPIIVVLTTDGVLTAHHVISFDSTHTPCTIKPSPVSLPSVRVGKKPDNFIPATVSTATPIHPVFGKRPGLSVTTSASAAPTSLFGSPSIVTSTPSKPPGSLFGATTTNVASSPMPSAPIAFSTPKPAPAVASEPKEPVAVPQKPVEPPKPAEDDLKAEVASANRALDAVRQKWNSWVNDLRALQVGIGHAEVDVRNAANCIKSDDFDVVTDFSKLVADTNSELEDVERYLRDLTVEAKEKERVILQHKNNEERLRVMRDSHSFDSDEKMRRITMAIDELKEKYAEGKKKLDSLAKPSKKKNQTPLVSINFNGDAFAQKQARIVEKSIRNMRWKIESLEEEAIQAIAAKNKAEAKKGKIVVEGKPEIKTLYCSESPSVHGIDILDARRKMRAILAAHKQKGVPKTRTLVPLPFANFVPRRTDPKAFNDLEKSLLNSFQAAQITSAADSTLNTTKSDAATQADAPVEVKIVEKPVYIQSPAPAAATPAKEAPKPGVIAFTPTTTATVPTSVIKKSPATDATASPPKTTLFGPPSSEKFPLKVLSDLGKGGFSLGSPLAAERKAPLTAKPSIYGISEESEKKETSELMKALTAEEGDDEREGKTFRARVGMKTKEEKAPSPLKAEEEKRKEEMKKEAERKQEEAEKKTEEVPKVEEKKEEEKAPEPAPAPKPQERPKKFSFAPISAEDKNTESVFAAMGSGKDTAQNTTTSIFGGGAATSGGGTKSIFGGAGATTGGDTAQKSTSIFGGAAGTTGSTGGTTSIFGGSTPKKEEPKSVFGGGFTTPAASTAATSAATTSPAVFSFKPKETTTTTAAPASSSSAFSFSKPSGGGATSSFAAAAAKAAVEEGMMDDESTATGGGSGGGAFGSFGGLSLGGGSSSTQQSAQQKPSIFGGGASGAQKSTSGFGSFSAAAQSAEQKPSIFGGGGAQKSSSGFGSFSAAAQGAAPKPSIFGGATAAQSTGQTPSIFGGGGQKSIFGGAGGGGAQQQQQAAPSSVFGGASAAPKFGAAPAFGAKPVFGGGAAFGGGNKPAAGAASGGGFAKYAGQSASSVFGGGAAQQPQQQQQQGSSPFGSWR